MLIIRSLPQKSGELACMLFILFISRSHQHCKKSVQSRQQNVCVQQTSFSAIFVLSEITAPIFQIMHI